MAIIQISITKKSDYWSVGFGIAVWILIAIFYRQLVTWIVEWSALGIDVEGGFEMLQLQFFGTYYSLLHIGWLITIICVYKAVDTLVDGLLVTTIDFALAIFVMVLFWNGIGIRVGMDEMVSGTFILHVMPLLIFLVGYYGALFVYELVIFLYLRTPSSELQEVCKEYTSDPNDPSCECFRDFIFPAEVLSKLQVKEQQYKHYMDWLENEQIQLRGAKKVEEINIYDEIEGPIIGKEESDIYDEIEGPIIGKEEPENLEEIEPIPTQ